MMKAMSRCEVIAAYQDGMRFFTGMNLSGTDFSFADLIGANFDRANLCSADFSYAKISGESFDGVDLSVVRGMNKAVKD